MFTKSEVHVLKHLHRILFKITFDRLTLSADAL